jgi:hypothetical protein
VTIDQMPVKECESCGTFYLNAHECSYDGRAPGVPNGAPGHAVAITPMKRGGYRAECGCGVHRDTESRYLAGRYLVWHIRSVKEKA